MVEDMRPRLEWDWIMFRTSFLTGVWIEVWLYARFLDVEKSISMETKKVLFVLVERARGNWMRLCVKWFGYFRSFVATWKPLEIPSALAARGRGDSGVVRTRDFTVVMLITVTIMIFMTFHGISCPSGRQVGLRSWILDGEYEIGCSCWDLHKIYFEELDKKDARINWRVRYCRSGSFIATRLEEAGSLEYTKGMLNGYMKSWRKSWVPWRGEQRRIIGFWDWWSIVWRGEYVLILRNHEKQSYCLWAPLATYVGGWSRLCKFNNSYGMDSYWQFWSIVWLDHNCSTGQFSGWEWKVQRRITRCCYELTTDREMSIA